MKLFRRIFLYTTLIVSVAWLTSVSLVAHNYYNQFTPQSEIDRMFAEQEIIPDGTMVLGADGDTIEFDNAQIFYSDRANTDYFIQESFTVGNGDDRILLVAFKSTGRYISGTPTYNGVSMTQLHTAGPVISDSYWKLYYIWNPNSGTNNIYAPLSNYSNGEYTMAISFSGVGSIGEDVASLGTNNSSSVTTNITPTTSNSILVDFEKNFSSLADVSPEGNNQTLRGTSATWGNGMSTKNNTSLSTNSMNWTFRGPNQGYYCFHSIVELVGLQTNNSSFFQLF